MKFKVGDKVFRKRSKFTEICVITKILDDGIFGPLMFLDGENYWHSAHELEHVKILEYNNDFDNVVND